MLTSFWTTFILKNEGHKLVGSKMLTHNADATLTPIECQPFLEFLERVFARAYDDYMRAIFCQ